MRTLLGEPLFFCLPQNLLFCRFYWGKQLCFRAQYSHQYSGKHKIKGPSNARAIYFTLKEDPKNLVATAGCLK